MNDLLSTARAAWQDFMRWRRPLVLFEVGFQLLRVWLLLPLAGLSLALVMRAGGHQALSDHEILRFLLTPLGILYAALFGVLSAALYLIEQAGLLAIAELRNSGTEFTLRAAARRVAGAIVRIAELGARKTLLLTLAAAPLVMIAVIAYLALLTEFDIYFYLTTQPANFWIAVGIGSVLLLTAAAIGAYYFVRWSLALPILLFENASPRDAMRLSKERVRGAVWTIAGSLLGWLLLCLLLSTGVYAGYRLFAQLVIQHVSETNAMLMMLLFGQASLVTLLSFITSTGLVLLIRRWYLARSPAAIAERPPIEENAAHSRWIDWTIYTLIALSFITPLTIWSTLAAISGHRDVMVTAHRGYVRKAPENTLSAIQAAIDVGADYVEVDVQRTADGVLVLLHDRDLMRVAHDPRRLDQMTFADVRKLDVGSWFKPEFASERVPTLAEAIDLCQGRIRMNIELKMFGPDIDMARQVAELVRDKSFATKSIITAFNYEALMLAKETNYQQAVGLIIAQSIGNLNRPGLSAVSVRADHLTNAMIADVQAAGREVMVWTVNDPDAMRTMILRGVDNLITSEPGLAITVRRYLDKQSYYQRVSVAGRLLLGITDPAPTSRRPLDETP